MALNAAFARIAEAIGLRSCRGFTLNASADSVMTVQAEQYATGEQLDGVARVLETREYVLVPRDTWRRDNELREAVLALIDYLNDKYPEKNPREWICPHLARLDKLVLPKEGA